MFNIDVEINTSYMQVGTCQLPIPNTVNNTYFLVQKYFCLLIN